MLTQPVDEQVLEPVLLQRVLTPVPDTCSASADPLTFRVGFQWHVPQPDGHEAYHVQLLYPQQLVKVPAEAVGDSEDPDGGVGRVGWISAAPVGSSLLEPATVMA